MMLAEDVINWVKIKISKALILDHDYSLGPALRTVYLRKAGSRKNFSLYGSTIGTKPSLWTKQRLWEFLENPEKMYPNTNMSFDGVSFLFPELFSI
jgi:cytochrome c2